MKSKFLILSFLFTSVVAMSQIVANQVDNFEDGTTQHWGIGGGASNQATNISTGGPNGVDDNFLSYSSNGMSGVPGSKMLVFNLNNQWSGDYTSASIVGIRFDVKVLTNDLALRIAVSDQSSSGSNPTQIVTTNAFNVPAGAGWITVTMPISASDFSYLLGPKTIAQVLSSVVEIRILHNTNPNWIGLPIVATLQMDNITALTSLSVNEQHLSDTFRIVQNPSNSKLILSLPRVANEIKLEVFDVLGKKIVSKQISGLTSIMDVSKWNDGVYLIRITSDNGTQTKRFLKK